MEITNLLYVKDRRAWRAWLSKHSAKEKVVWLVYYRKSSGKPRIPYNDAVEEALCFGWIDSTVKRVDEEKFVQRFTPRRKGSVLSQMNKERIGKLISQKRMTKAGLRAVAHAYKGASEHKKAVIPGEIRRELRKNKEAWKNFQKLPESYKRIRIAYIMHRKIQGAAAFKSSLAHFIKKTEGNKRFGFVRE